MPGFGATAMLTRTIIFIAIILAGVAASPTVPIGGSPNLPNISVNFVSQNNQQIAGNCYNVQVILNVTSNLNTAFIVTMRDFYIYEQNSPALTVNNQQYWTQANNTVNEFLFPSDNIQLQINFANFCIVSSTGLQVWLLYNSGLSPYKTRIF